MRGWLAFRIRRTRWPSREDAATRKVGIWLARSCPAMTSNTAGSGTVLDGRAVSLGSLSQVHRSITALGPADEPAPWRRWLAFVGPGYLVAVGYMDPGNWATSLAGGSQFGYSLLAVILISNLVAMAFQAAAVRLGICSGRDLAQACRANFPPAVNLL